MMQSGNRSSGSYEQIITASFLLFLRSMQLFGQVGHQAAGDPGIFRNQKIQKGLEQIIKTIDACGSGLERLPDPPRGAEAADRRFRELGKDIRGFPTLLRDLTSPGNGADRQQAIRAFQSHADRTKRRYREAILMFEQAYPGRLSRVLSAQTSADAQTETACPRYSE